MKYFLTLLTLLVPSIACPAVANERSLVESAENQDWSTVSQLIDHDQDTNERQPDGMTSLHWAAYWNQPIVISRLVSANAQVDAVNDYGVTPLAIACRFGHLNAATVLLDAGADVNGHTNGKETLLMHAARAGNVDLVRLLIDRGASIDAQQSDDQTALMWAADAGNAGVVRLLLQRGAKRDVKLRSGFSALHFAARQGHADVVMCLIESGADVNERMNPQKTGDRAPRKGMSPLMLAVESAHFELALQLVDWGADPNDQRSGYAPLHALTWVRRPSRGDNAEGDPPPVGSGDVGSLQFARELIARGAQVQLPLNDGKYAKAKLNVQGATPLLLAAFTGDLPYARLLVELGADVRQGNVDGTTPMLAAAGVGVFVADEYPGTEDETVAMIDQLVQWGADIHDVDAHGETVIHGAAYRSFAKAVDRLVEHGADAKRWYRRNSLGSTPRDIAEGKRPGSFKPNQATIAAIDRALQAAGIQPEQWQRDGKEKAWDQ